MVFILNKRKLSSILATGALMVTVAPALGTFVQVGNNIAHAEVFKAGSTGTRTIKFNVKAGESVTSKTETVTEPVDLILVVDGSGSFTEPFNDGKNPSRRKFQAALIDAAKLVESLPEGSQVMIASYTWNTTESYTSNRITNLIPKADAARILKDILNKPSDLDWYTTWERYLSDVDKKIYSSYEKLPYEEAYEKSTAKKNKYVSVVQFTDEWVPNEDIDTSFAEWSKKNAKTFMSVIYNKTDNPAISEAQMKKIGHPNIYNARGKTDDQRQKDIVEKFKTSGLKTTVIKNRVSPDGVVTVNAEKGVDITEVELVSPKGVKEKLEKQPGDAISWSWKGKFAEDGEYTLNYKFTGTPSETKSITGTVQVSNKEVAKAVDTIEPNKSSDVDTAKEDIPFKTIEEKDPTLPFGERKVKVKGVLGERTITKTYDVLNGKRVGDPKVDTKVTKEPVDEVVLVGTKVEEKVTYKTIHKGDDGKILKEENIAAEKSEFEGYKYVKTEADNSDKLNVVTTHHYHKLTTTYKGVDENGKEVILEKVDGTKDKKDFKGYIFEKTEKLDNGDVVHHYKAKKADEKKKPVETGASAGSMLLPIGALGASVALVGVAKFKSKRK